MFSRDKGNDSDDGSDGGNNNGDNELPSLESVFSDSSEISLKNRGELFMYIRRSVRQSFLFYENPVYNFNIRGSGGILIFIY